MKITVIGTMGAYPSLDSPTCSYLIEEGSEKILIDCGSGVAMEVQKYTDLKDIGTVIISHSHYDHSSDLGVLLYSSLIDMQLGRRERPLEVLIPYVTEIPHFLKDYVKILGYCEEDNFKISESYTVLFRKSLHDVTCYSMKITDGKSVSFGFTHDTGFSENTADFLKGSEYLFCECSYYAHQDGLTPWHMTSIEAGRTALISEPLVLILTHFPHYGEKENLLKEVRAVYRGEVKMAFPGLIITQKD